MEKGDFKGARETEKILDRVDTSKRLLNLFKNAKSSLLKKNNKNYDCGKTVVWVILLAYCHVDVENSITREETCLALKNKEVDEKKFSQFLLEEMKKISKEFKVEKQKLTFDHLIIKFAETNQKIRHERKWYKFTSLVKEILHIPVVSGEIRVEEVLKIIDEEYKGKLDDLRISPCGISLNWETTKLLMDDDERKYYENREKEINL